MEEKGEKLSDVEKVQKISDEINRKVLGKKPIAEWTDSEVLRELLANSTKTISHLSTIKSILIFFLVLIILGLILGFFGTIISFS